MIETRNLTKKYGSLTALDNITFESDSGILGVCGARGSGKSSLLAILAGAIPQNSGEAFINQKEAKKVFSGYLLEEDPLFDEMSVSEFLFFIGEAKKIPYEKLYRQVKEVLDLCNLEDFKDVPISNLKKGTRKMTGIAHTLLGNPELVVLDEPFAGMNKQEISSAKAIIKMLGEIKTVVLSSSYPTDVSDICSKMILLSGGKLVACDTVENLTSAICDIAALSLSFNASADITESFLQSLTELDGVSECIVIPTISENEYRLKLIYDGKDSIKEDIENIISEKEYAIEIKGIEQIDVTLDDLCISLDNAKEDN